MTPFTARIIARAGLVALALAQNGVATPARADVYLVVPVASSIQSLTHKEATDLYTGRTRLLPNGDVAQLFDLPRESQQRALFYRTLTGMSLAQINSYWSRLMFSGQHLPPQPLANERAVVETLRRNPGALGYLTTRPTDAALRTVLVLASPEP